MKVIKLSPQLLKAYKGINVDISYALTELVGAVDYDIVGTLTTLPMSQIDPIEVEVSDESYEALTDVFDGMQSIDSVAEIMLWTNLFMGGSL